MKEKFAEVSCALRNDLHKVDHARPQNSMTPEFEGIAFFDELPPNILVD